MADKIKDLDQEARDIWRSAGEDLQSRFGSVTDEIEKITRWGRGTTTGISPEEGRKLNELRKEEKQLKQALGAEWIKEATRQAELTETQKIIEARDLELMKLDEKRLKLAEEKIALETAKAEELKILKSFEAEQLQIDNIITENFLSEVEIRKNWFDELISKAREFNAVSGWLGISAEVWRVAGQQFSPSQWSKIFNDNRVNVEMWWLTTAQNGNDFAWELERSLSWIRK